MTITEIQKKAQSLGLPSVKTKLSRLMGYSPTYLRDIEERNKNVDKRFLIILYLHEKVFNLKNEIKQIKEDRQELLYIYKVTGTYKEDAFVYAHSSSIKSSNIFIDDDEDFIYNDALNAVVIAYRFDFSLILNLKIERVDNKKDQQKLKKEVLFI